MSELPEFDRQQYADLRGEVDRIVAEIRLTERGVLLATWAIWTFVAADGGGVANLKWLPLPLVIVAGLRVGSLYMTIPVRSAYLRRIECATGHASGLEGWDNFLEPRRKKSYGLISTLGWVALLLASVFVPLLIFKTAA